MMRNIQLHKVQGFTLVELVITLVLISLLSSLAAIVVLGPFQVFYTMRDNIKLFAQFDQASDDLEYYFNQAAPISIKVSDDKQTLTFRTVQSRGWVGLSLFSTQTRSLKKHKLLEQILSSSAYIFFPGHPEIGIQQIEKKNNQLSFVNREFFQTLKGRGDLRYELLSSPIDYQFKPEVSQLWRRGESLKGNVPYEALVSDLSDCEFFWLPSKKRLNIKMSIKDSRQQAYRFRQQLALY